MNDVTQFRIVNRLRRARSSGAATASRDWPVISVGRTTAEEDGELADVRRHVVAVVSGSEVRDDDRVAGGAAQ